MIAEIHRKPDTWFWFQFDGTQQSIDDLLVQLNGGGGGVNADAKFESATEWKYWNSYFSEPEVANGTLDTIVVFRRQVTGPVVIAADYPNQAAADIEWEI